MKNIIAVTIASLFHLNADAQKVSEKNIPEAVKSAFMKQYPKADDAEWEMENLNYEVEFEMEDREFSAVFSKEGTFIEIEKEILVDALPDAAKQYVIKNYPDKKIKEAAEITMADGSKKYEAEIKGQDLIFNSKGEFIEAVKD